MPKNIKAVINSFYDLVRSYSSYNNNINAYSVLLNERLNELNTLSLKDPQKRQEMMRYFYEVCSPVLKKGFMQTYCRQKPLGYAGDFMAIEYIYTYKIEKNNGYEAFWDEYFHLQDATEAVRNRKDFFVKILSDLLKKRKTLGVLNIASGPCRDIVEGLQNNISKIGKIESVHFHCVDIDHKAIEFAQNLLNCNFPSGKPANITFLWDNNNALKIKSSKKFDLVWSAGLFDYLQERSAVALIKKMWTLAKEGGRIIWGNFHPRNNSRNSMEWIGDWFLIHRTEEEMLKICKKAGVPIDSVSFESEPLGINLFCVIDKI